MARDQLGPGMEGREESEQPHDVDTFDMIDFVTVDALDFSCEATEPNLMVEMPIRPEENTRPQRGTKEKARDLSEALGKQPKRQKRVLRCPVCTM